MTTIHIVSSGKGNVGKSAFANVLECIAFAAGSDPQLIDADDQKQTLSKMHKSATKISMSDDPELENHPDAIWYLAETNSRDVIVDLAAQTDIHLNRWLDNRGVVAAAAQKKIRLIRWWVSDANSDSLQDLAALSERYSPDDITHVLVKSLYRVRPIRWESELMTSNAVKTAIANGTKVIEFPKLFGTLIEDMRKGNKQLKEIILDDNHKSIDMLNRSTVMRWVDLCREQIETVYKFESVKKATKSIKKINVDKADEK